MAPSLKLFLLAGLSLLSSPVLASATPSTKEAGISRIDNAKGRVVARAEKKKTPKYFNEPGGSLARSHYDKRWFKDEVPYTEHRVVLRDLVRSYLTTLSDYGVETWLAHGTLLGWWWNGQIMPWDYDLDVQLSNNTMQWLTHNLNQTEHRYNSTADDGKVVTKTYFLDINPHWVDVTRGDGMNIIDARWIDMQNGMFVDMTVLRERDRKRPGLWSCKNNHQYHSQDLWPMRVTEFEGVKARIPYSFEKILTDEYKPKSLTNEEHQEHKWNHDIKEWVKNNENDAKNRVKEAIARKKKELEAQGRL